MLVSINGRQEDVAGCGTVLQLLQLYELNPEITIVEKNREILPRERYAAEPVAEHDCFELIRYMGGG